MGDSLSRAPLEPNQALSVPASDIRDARDSPDLLDVVLVIGAFIAPMDLSIFKSFTVYDLSIALLAFLIVAGPMRLRSLPPAFLAAASLFLATAVLSALQRRNR